ncbi:MAG: short chain dehydrogenase [Pseudomonadota bacterium]|jgi:NADP-dependent 3-hydroxy acid dehydrogenase YdfG|nr:short chain dehydrogenase [Pseudomonadota bacterium]MEC8041009.1 short chain dehydrogenase [Pseudomonadota bacterium]MEC8293771.1 short chain dehydrogenase [Pseudomonadota bacterium]
MKILLIGATGIIGSAIHQALSGDHQVVTAGRSAEMDHHVDLGDPAAVKALFVETGPLDAIIAAAGAAGMVPLTHMTDAQMDAALEVQMKGQMNLIRYGHPVLPKGGSIVLTSGTAAQHTYPGTAAIAASCAALEAFVRVATAELPDLRINLISPIFVKETMAKLGQPELGVVSAADTAQAYLRALNGDMRGDVLTTLAA